MVEGFIKYMLPRSSYLQAPTIVKDSITITNRNKMKDLDPTAVDKNTNASVEHANTELEANNSLGSPIVEEKREWFTNAPTTMMCGIVTPTHLRKGIEMGSPIHLPVILMFSTLPKPNKTGSQKQEL